jgi:pSer/pThr/pTyr-binding forkhead associated (FHA) protein
MSSNPEGSVCPQCNSEIAPDGVCLNCVFKSAKQAELEKSPSTKAQLFLKASNERYGLNQSVSKIGRDENNDITLPKDAYISRHHAWVLYIKGLWWIEDLGSTNGTFVNGDPVLDRQQLFPGDSIRLGRTDFLFEVT